MNPSREPFMTRGARYAVVFLFVLTLAVGTANLLFTSALVNRVSTAKASVVQLCQLGNESRAQQITLWTHLVVVSRPPPHETVADRTRRVKTTREFIAYVKRVFMPRNSQKVGNT